MKCSNCGVEGQPTDIMEFKRATFAFCGQGCIVEMQDALGEDWMEALAQLAGNAYLLCSARGCWELAEEGTTHCLDHRGDDRRVRQEAFSMPSRATVLRDIAEEIRKEFPLEALMLDNMAKSMDREDSGHILFNRRVAQ